MASAGLHWSNSPRAMAGNVRAYGQAVTLSLSEFAEVMRDSLERYARSNAPWSDRSGNARATLTAAVERRGDAVRVTLSHGVFYGIYLELKHAGRWGIVLRALQAHAPVWAAWCRARGFR